MLSWACGLGQHFQASQPQIAYIYFHQLSSPKLFSRYEISCEVQVFLQKQFLSSVAIKATWNQTRFTGLWGCVENHFVRAIEHFFRCYIASSIHSMGWENSRKSCKSSTTSPVLHNCLEFSQTSSCLDEKVLYCLIVAVLFCIGNLLNSKQRKSFFDVVKEEWCRTIKV